MYLLVLWVKRSCLIFSSLSSPCNPRVYFDFGGRKNLMEPEALEPSVALLLANDGESVILFTPSRSTGDF